MKRLMPSSLRTFLQNNPNCQKADLFVIVCKNGVTIYVTEGQWDIVVPSGTGGWAGGTTTFSANLYGRWSRGQITSEATFSLQTGTMSLTCVPQQGTQFPGISVGILNAAWNGLFDAASVTVYTAYFAPGASNYGNVSNGLETKFGNATIMKATDINRVSVTFDVADANYLLNLRTPSRTFAANCPWSYGDGNCNPVGGIKTQTFTAASGSTAYVIVPNSVTGNMATNGYYAQGVIKCTSGLNSGLSGTVKLHESGSLTMTLPWLVAPAVGDSFIVTAGCDKSVTTCDQKFGNKAHFGGETEVPVPAAAF
jgi:uncharacterized phage protein (TIGR02218 family)